MGNTEFTNFKLGLKHPKLSWVISQLNRYGIRHNVIRTLKGEMLQVERGTLELASSILDQTLAEFTAKVKGYEEGGPTFQITVTLDDLPNDHPFFEILHEYDLGYVKSGPEGEVKEVNAKTLESVIKDPSQELTDEDINEIFTPPVVPAKTEELSWDMDDDDDDIIDVEAKVVVDEDFADAGEAEPPKPREPRVPKEVKTQVDPDFDEAESEELPSVAPTMADFTKIDEIVPFVDVEFPGVKAPIRMYDVPSTNISAIGAKDIAEKPMVVTVYVLFKTGNVPYRYNPVQRKDFNEILNEIIRKAQGIQEASVGSMYHHVIKVPAEEGRIQCQRFNEEKGKWVKVLPKAERTKAIKERAETNK